MRRREMNKKTNFVSKMLAALISDATSVSKISEEVISGKKKLAEVQILARGGPGISKRTKRLNKKALKKLERRYNGK